MKEFISTIELSTKRSMESSLFEDPEYLEFLKTKTYDSLKEVFDAFLNNHFDDWFKEQVILNKERWELDG